MAKTILIFGGSGFVGSNIAFLAKKMGHKVYFADKTQKEKLSDFNLVSDISTQLIKIFAIIIAFCISADITTAQSITIDISKPGATV